MVIALSFRLVWEETVNGASRVREISVHCDGIQTQCMCRNLELKAQTCLPYHHHSTFNLLAWNWSWIWSSTSPLLMWHSTLRIYMLWTNIDVCRCKRHWPKRMQQTCYLGQKAMKQSSTANARVRTSVLLPSSIFQHEWSAWCNTAHTGNHTHAAVFACALHTPQYAVITIKTKFCIQ